MKITTIVSITVAVVASTISVSAAVAAPVENQMRVTYTDLELGTAAGKAMLDRRITTAASQVCGYDKTQRQMGTDQSAGTCNRRAIAKARVDFASATQPALASR